MRSDYLTLMVLFTFLVALLASVVAIGRRRSGHTWRVAIRSVIRPGGLAISLGAIAVMTVFPPYPPEISAVWLNRGRDLGINLIPLRTITGYLASLPSRSGVVQLLGNVLLFMPFGFFLALGARRRMSSVIVIGVAMSVFVEAVQFVVGRSVDIDDVILNGLGVLAGLGIAKASFVHRSAAC